MNPKFHFPLAFALLTVVLHAVPVRAGNAFTFENPSGTLTLRQALRLALLQNPELAAADTETRAAEARQLQAGLLPNPTLEATAENVLGSGPYRGARATEGTIQLNQLVELGGKRAARLAVARRGRELAGFDYEGRRLEVFARTTGLFVQALAAQRRLALARETRELTEGIIPAIEQRISAGAANAVEAVRARTAAASIRIEETAATREAGQARGRLAASWGAREARFSSVVGDLETLPALPALDTLTGRLEGNPAIARFPTEIEQRQAELTLAKAAAVPDPSFGGAYRRFAETGDNAAVLQVRIALPVLDRNQGNIRAARANLIKTAQLQQATAAELSAQLDGAYRAAVAARRDVDTLREQVLPGAEEAFRLLNEGFATGRYGQLELLDARRTLVTARGQLLVAQGAYHQALAEITGLTGRPPAGPPPVSPFNVPTETRAPSSLRK